MSIINECHESQCNIFNVVNINVINIGITYDIKFIWWHKFKNVHTEQR